MKSFRLSILPILSMVLFAASLALQAQTSPDVEQGMKPYGSYHGGAIDNVSLTNQNLYLHAPLFAYSQRGGELAFPVSLLYNNKVFKIRQTTLPCAAGTPPNLCPKESRILFGPAPLGNGMGHGNSVQIWVEPYPGVAPVQTDTSLSFNGNKIYVYPNYTVSPDGSVHQLASTDSGFAALDGSGFASGPGLGAIDSNGTSSGVSVATDRNGNSLGSNSMTSPTIDTLGRQIAQAPVPTIPPAAPNPSTASLSACPALNYAFQPVTYAYTWSLPTVNGGTLPLILCYASVWVRTGTSNGPILYDVNQSYPMLQSVVFPDTSYWAFQYDAADPNNSAVNAYGDLLKVTFPTGGSISYTWAIWSAGCSSGIDRAVMSRTVDANDGTGPHTWSYNNGVVTDPQGNDTVHVTSMLGDTCSLYETETRYYQGSQSAGTLLKTVHTDYQYTVNPYDPAVIGTAGALANATSVINVFPIRVTTTLPNGLVSKVETGYDNGLVYHGPLDGITSNIYECPNPTDPPSGCFYGAQTTVPVSNYTGSYGKAISRREYDWGQGAPGPLLRETQTTYQWQVNSAYLTANLLNLPAVVKVLDGAGRLCAETDYAYDETTPITPSPAISTQHVVPTTTIRGNLTTTTHKLSATPCAANATWTNVTSHSTWFDTGELQSSTDPLGHTTTHLYDSAYAGAYSTQTCSPSTYNGTVAHCVSGTYDFNTGLLTSFTNENATQQAGGTTPGDAAHTSNFTYDNYWRMTSAQAPPDPANGNTRAQTNFTYSAPNAVPITVNRQKSITSALMDSLTATFDGVGRSIKTGHATPAGTATVDTVYDALSQVSSVSNPYFATTDPTYGITRYSYDALGRSTQTTKQDGSVSTVSYAGNCVTATDEAGKSRKSCSDALGRLTGVWEDPGGLNYETDYQYDPLGNLVRVDQKGSAPGDSTQWRTRLFTYDSLSRLLTGQNPESGKITYSYDNDGNVATKTDARGIVTTFTYDAQHRVTLKSNSDNTAASYTYDQTGVWGPAETNTVGRLVLTYDGNHAATLFSYDVMGRIVTQWDCPPSTWLVRGYCLTVSAHYDLGGDLTQLIYPNGEVVNYTPWNNGTVAVAVPQEAKDTGSSINFAQSASYGPDGSLTGFVSGQRTGFSGYTNAFTYNNRLQPVNMSAASPSATLFNITYDFHNGSGNNGNVWGILNNREHTRDQSFTYDRLNRLASGQNAGTNCAATTANGKTEYWGNNYTYDAWGNLLAKTVTKCGAENMSLTADGHNWLHASGTDYQYDAAGNMTFNATPPAQSYTYDAESRITQINSGAVQYTYDPAMGRVRKDVSGQPSTEYYYFGNEIVAEQNISTGGWTNYVFFGGDRVARREYPSGDVSYYFSDHLKTASVIADAAGTVKAESDYYPWGGELQLVNNDTNHYKFTGKERDSETGLDYFGARYYSNGLGRFITPDLPFADQHKQNPQTWNLYTYGRNNPLGGIDPNGRGYICLQCVYDAVANWWNSGVKRDGGVGNFAKQNGIGAAKGTGSFGVNTARVGVAFSQAANGNAPGAVATMMAPGPKALQPSNQTQAQASTVMQTVVLPMASAAIPLGELGTAGSTEATLTRLATQAVDNVGPGSGAAYGTAVHSEFADLVEASTNLSTEVSYKGGQVVEYGTPGSVRVDAVEGPIDAPTCCYDLKTGSATLTPARTAQIQNELPGGSNVPVKEIKPQ
jgi:RHS repeat-associated protein